MGYGDFLLAAGQAKLMHQESGKKIAIGNGNEIQQHELYSYVPYLCNPKKYKGSFEWLLDWVGHRDYILRKENNGGKQLIFNPDYRAEPCTLDIEPIENDYIIIEPLAKCRPGKVWHHYQEVVNAFPDEKWLQFNMPTLEGVEVVKTNLVQAAQWMAGCRFYVGTEGFLHHLAAAFGKPAVVLFGGYAPPEILGYDIHRNIAVEAPGELGHFKRVGAMARITPQRVIEEVRRCCRKRPIH
jgi:hypothetical protein